MDAFFYLSILWYTWPRRINMLLDWISPDIAQMASWLVIAIAAVAILVVILYIVGKIVSISLRVAIILGSLIVIAIALFVLSTLITQGMLPGL